MVNRCSLIGRAILVALYGSCAEMVGIIRTRLLRSSWILTGITLRRGTSLRAHLYLGVTVARMALVLTLCMARLKIRASCRVIALI